MAINLLILSLANKIEFGGGVSTSSWLNAGEVKKFFFEKNKPCFFPFSVNSISCAMPICGPFGEALHFPPAAVTVICKPQQAAKIFCSFSKHFFANSICFLISLLLSLTLKVLPVKIIPLYFFSEEIILLIDWSSLGDIISISLFASIFFTCFLKFSDCGIHPAVSKLISPLLQHPRHRQRHLRQDGENGHHVKKEQPSYCNVKMSSFNK